MLTYDGKCGGCGAGGRLVGGGGIVKVNMYGLFTEQVFENENRLDIGIVVRNQ